MIPTPLEYLQIKLVELESARRKCETAVKNMDIDLNVHIKHINNLNPMIQYYRFAIKQLEEYMP